MSGEFASEVLRVARVVMPEKGLFLVRCPSPPPAYGAQVLVTLDYGADLGTVTETAVYDPDKHGPRPPGFQLVREKLPEDDKQIAANETLSQAMCSTFVKTAQIPDLRIPYVRLSYGRTRLFIRFTAGQAKPDLARPMAELRRLFGVSVNAWQMGPRDEVSVLGGLGPCGRPCCCCTWQQRYPAHLSADRARGENPAALNGTCGRFKCCLAFEKGCDCGVRNNRA